MMAYSRTNMKSNGNKASPSFKPFLTGNVSQKYLYVHTSLQVTFKDIIMNLVTSCPVLYTYEVVLG
jgi:hypothetical protein